MVEQVWEQPAVFRIEVPMRGNPLRAINSYVICSEGESLIVDTGFNRPECRETLFEGLRELDLDISRTQVLLTHLHSDHSGLLEEFHALGVPVYIHELDRKNFLTGQTPEIRSSMNRLYESEGFPGWLAVDQTANNQGFLYAPKAMPAHGISDGHVFRIGTVEARTIWVPGHSAGQVVLYFPAEKILFSADHVLFNITPNIGVWNQREGVLQTYMDSLRKIRNLPVNMVFPGHRRPSSGLKQRVDELLEHHDERLKEIHQAVKDIPGRCAYEIAEEIHWSSHGKAWKDFSAQQQWFAFSEVLAHLYHLTGEGRLVRKQMGGICRYFLT